MADIDYGVNANDPQNAIAVILDSVERAKFIVDELDGLGFLIVPKEATEQMCQALFEAQPGKECPLAIAFETGDDKDVRRLYELMLAAR